MLRLLFILFFLVIFGSISWVLPEIYLTVLVLGTGIPHIILGAKNSQRGLSSAFNVYWKKALVLSLIPLSFILGIKWGAIGLVFYFAIHHAISETYSQTSFFEKNGLFTLLYSLLILTSYLIACRGDFEKYNFLLSGVFVFFFLSLLSLLFITRKYFSKLETLKTLFISYPWLLIAPALCLLTLYNPISWMVLILYHFAFWGLLPLFRSDIFKGDKNRLKAFWTDALLWNGLGILGIGTLAWWSTKFVDFRLFQIVILSFYIATYWHITISFIISGSNPLFIRRLFMEK